MPVVRVDRSRCPISMGLELFGDPWSLLIIRDLMFKNVFTFGGFLQAGEGIASNVLTDRLDRLERADLVERGTDPGDGRKVVYLLTERGLALAPVLMEIVIWSADHEDTAAPPDEVRAMKEQRAAVLEQVRDRWMAQRRRYGSRNRRLPANPGRRRRRP